MVTTVARASMPNALARNRAPRVHHRIADVEESETQHGYRVAALKARRQLTRDRIAAFAEASRDLWLTSRSWHIKSATVVSTLPSFAVVQGDKDDVAIQGWESEGGSVRPPPIPQGAARKLWLKVKRVLRGVANAITS